MNRKRIAILGSTGSIGIQTLDVIQNNKEFVVKVNANQADAGLVDLDSGNLKLVMNANVTSLAFDNASQVSKKTLNRLDQVLRRLRRVSELLEQSLH